MSLAGHEDSGTVAETLDDDLVGFLKEVMSTKDELVLFLMADHGMRYGEWFKVLDGSHEHKLPSLFILASSSLLQDIPYAVDTLQHNTERLVSKLDLHKTLMYLGELPYYRGWTEHNSKYSSWKLQGGGAGLFTTKIPNIRTCDMAFVPSFFCSCLKFKTIEPAIYTSPQNFNESVTQHLVNYFADEIIRQINDEVYTSMTAWTGRICQKLTMNRLELVEWQFLSTTRHYYKLVFSVNESKTARFEAVIMLSTNFMPAHSSQTGYRVLPIYTDGRRQFRIMYIKRQDAYAGICEEISKAMGVPAPLCICSQISDIRRSFPALFESLQSQYHMTTAKPGISCSQYCESQGLLCNSPALALLNLCSELSSCAECFEAENQKAYPGVRSGTCFVSRHSDFDCDANEVGVSRFCVCEVPT